MKLRVLFPAVLLTLFAGDTLAIDLATHPYFKNLIGEWKAEGELKGTDGNTVKIIETWTGKADAEGTFHIEGTRILNGDQQTFQWSIIHNSTTDGYEATMSSSDGQSIRFEGSVSEATLTMDLKAITGTGSSSISVHEFFEADSKDIMKSDITFTGEQGETTLEGTLTHQRVKTP